MIIISTFISKLTPLCLLLVVAFISFFARGKVNVDTVSVFFFHLFECFAHSFGSICANEYFLLNTHMRTKKKQFGQLMGSSHATTVVVYHFYSHCFKFK